jgi:ABC-2 type transport system permease protein
MERIRLLCKNLCRITYLESLWGLRVPESLVYNFFGPALVLILLGLIRGNKDYLHILVSGVIAMTIASSALQGIGTKMSFMRAYGSWRTLQASPIPTSLYFLGLVCSRMVRIVLITAFLLAMAVIFLRYRTQGNVALIFLYVVIGTFVFSSLGLVIASLVRSPQAVSGILNMVLLPMIFTSDVLFISNIAWVKTISLMFPLTFLVRLIRDNLQGAGPGSNWMLEIGVLAIWFILCSWAALGLIKRSVEER